METDFLVIGSGIAGLSFALKAATLGQVLVFTKKEKIDTATNLAQGGIAAVLDSKDTYENHINDTLISGDGLCDPEVVDYVVTNGPERIRELISLGVKFVLDDNGSLSLGKEGGHSNRRVAHAYDLTGREIEKALVHNASTNPNIEIVENHMCIDLITVEVDGRKKCCGAYILTDSNDVISVKAKNIVLCTGGTGKVYLYTSNPDIATGDGVAIASRAGADITNMEFVQFHPTCLYHHDAKNFLISEAVRGEGALLLNEKGERFLSDYEPKDMELATRDKVARAIDKEMKKSGADCVYLDISHKTREYLQNRFPTIYTKCYSLGIDISEKPIPVVPAAHYLCGGVKTDLYGRSSIDNLFSLGETACTGLHGGNRLASNSLLEAVVFAESSFQYCKSSWRELSTKKLLDIPTYHHTGHNYIKEEILINHNWDVIRRVMWNYVGIVRKVSRLKLAKTKISEVRQEIEEIILNHRPTANMLELRNISLVASMIIDASLQRKKSIGLHYIFSDDEQ